MERLTTNKPVDEMSMLELAYNSCYAENGKAMYRDFESVKDVRDFVREANVYLLDSVLPADDDEFDERMIDDLQYDPTIYVRGLIALFYRNLWAMADLRETLKAYEDKQEQGLLFIAPCKIGEKVWYLDKYDYEKPEVIGGVVDGYLWFRSCGFALDIVWDKPIMGHFAYTRKEMPFSEIGKTVFFTEAEAEEALAKMGGKA